jgi:putative oxidoreductase
MHGMEKLRPLALLLLRVGLGVVFIYNGFPKPFGHTREAIYKLAHEAGLPAYLAYLASFLGLVGGVMLVAGLCTRLIGLLLAGEMVIALWKIDHFFAHPLAVDQYELAMALAVGAFALATFGAGSLSLDAALFGKGAWPGKTKSNQ